MTDLTAHLSSVHLYPLKSGAAIDIVTALVEPEGLAGDRSLMVVDATGECMTSRRFPALLTLRCVVEGDEIVLIAPGRRPCAFSRLGLVPAPHVPARIWDQQVQALDAGDRVAGWLADFLGHPLRLVLKGPETNRPLHLGAGGVVSFADTAPLLLIGATSLQELNAYIEEPVEMARFRPNIVVSGGAPFAEDGWGRIRIGAVEFEVAGACDRCVVTTLDPQSGDGREDKEPLATLAKRRRGADGKPYFGQFLIPRSTGRIFVGDPIEVLSRKTPVVLAEPPPMRRISPQGSYAPTRRKGHFPLICTGVTHETPDMATFRFRAEDGMPVAYRPGQFITLHLDIEGVTVRRSYTVSSTPSRAGNISITVKRAASGFVSHWLHANLKPGDRIMAAGPHGQFHIDAAGDGQKLFMVSAGSGVTPMMSMLRYIADLDLPHDVVFHHSARWRDDLPFMDELSAIRRQMGGRLRLSWNLTGEPDLPRSASVHAGRFDAAMASAICPDLAERVTLCCGPWGFRSAVKGIHEVFAPAALYLEESFGADGAAADEAVAAAYDVTFTASDVTVKGHGTDTILELARRSGIDLPADCEAGICGTCRCRVTSGEWRLAPNCADPERTVLSEDEKSHAYVLACSTRPIGCVTIDL